MKKLFLFFCFLAIAGTTYTYGQEQKAPVKVSVRQASQSAVVAPVSNVPANTSEKKSAPARKNIFSSRTAAKDTNAQSVLNIETYSPTNLATFVFIVNKGDVFGRNDEGVLTSVTLSGFQKRDIANEMGGKDGFPGAINVYSCGNSLTLTGNTLINDYSSTPSSQVTASMQMYPIAAPQGMTLTLVVDGKQMSVNLPFVAQDHSWDAGNRYVYTILVNGNALAVTGVTTENPM